MGVLHRAALLPWAGVWGVFSLLEWWSGEEIWYMTGCTVGWTQKVGAIWAAVMVFSFGPPTTQSYIHFVVYI